MKKKHRLLPGAASLAAYSWIIVTGAHKVLLWQRAGHAWQKL